MPDKTITGYLVVDWKDETHRTRKSKPSASDLGANELLANLRVNVTVPEVEVPTLEVDIDVPEPQVHAAELDALDSEDLPDWTNAADDHVEARLEPLRAADRPARDDIKATIVVAALKDAPGRPDPALVEEYVDHAVAEQLTETTPDA